VIGTTKAQPPFSRGLSTAERAVFIGALWWAERRLERVFRRPKTARAETGGFRRHREEFDAVSMASLDFD
jgi:hypothetical protein